MNLSTNDRPLIKLVGQYKPGYAYGNAKTHKSITDPALRLIISHIGSPAYDVPKSLNFILKKYIPAKYSINSTDEFIQIIKSSPSTGLMTSLDVTSLFTNVPVNATIDIILNEAYNNIEIPPPKNP